MNEELLEILTLLKKNTSAILAENEKLKKEIETLKNSDSTEEPDIPNIDYDGGLLGDLRNVDYRIGNNIECSFEEGCVILEGDNRYANLAIIYYEKEEDYVPNIKTEYQLHIEGYKNEGCSNAYINSTSNPITDENFSIDLNVYASWERNLRTTIFLNNANGEDSKMTITSLKLTKSE